MKIDNKGMTLTELLASITMLTIAMVMMYGLMANLQKKKSVVDANSENLIPIVQIEKSFQEIVMEPINYGRNNITENVKFSADGETYSDSIYLTDQTQVYIKYNTTNKYKIEISENNKIIIQDMNNSDKKISQKLKKSCKFKEGNIGNNPYNIIIKCEDGNSINYIKFPMYFKTS